MKKKLTALLLSIALIAVLLVGCGQAAQSPIESNMPLQSSEPTQNPESSANAVSGSDSIPMDSSLPKSRTPEANVPSAYSVGEHITPSDLIGDIIEHPAFQGYGEKLLPSVGDQNNLDISFGAAAGGSDGNIENIAASLNHLIDDAAAGQTIYYDFYSEQERQDDPAKAATGLFFYRGEPGAPFAVISPGGAFAFVGSFQAGFPYAKEISDSGYNAFVLKYRTGGGVAMKRRAEEIGSRRFILNDEALG